MKCLSDYGKLLCNSLLLIAVLNTNLIDCDILVNNKTTNKQNASACGEVECSSNIKRDHHVLIVDYMKESSSNYNAYGDRLKHLSILYGIALLAQENELNQRCYNEIMQIYDGINHKEIWAIKGEPEYKFLLTINACCCIIENK